MKNVRRIHPPWWILLTAAGLLLALMVTATPPEPSPDVILASGDEDPPAYATHNPPLLVLPGETPELRYEVVCTRTRDDDTPCEREGDVYVRAFGSSSYERLPLTQGAGYERTSLSVPVPPSFLESGGFTYYATLRGGDRSITLPSGGRSGPHRAWVMEESTVVDLQDRPLDDTRPADRIPLDRPWGDGPNDVGLQSGEERSTIGPASFDLAEDGSLLLMDQVNGRVIVREAGGDARPVPVDVRSSFPDIAAGPAGDFYVLESSSPDEGRPALKRFSDAGKTLASTRIAEWIPSKVRPGPHAPYVYQYPSSMWLPALDRAGGPLSAIEQARRATPALPNQRGRGAVVKVLPEEIRVALTNGRRVLSGWTVTAPTVPGGVNLGPVQLADPLRDGVLVAFAAYTDTEDAFRVLRLGPDGVDDDFTVASGNYAETASVSRFRLAPDGDLYQLRSSERGAEVVAFDLGGASR